MRDELKRVYQDVNDWLKYAESKNAALVVANIAIVFGLLQILNSINSACFYFRWYAYSVVLVLLISTAICLLSFVPQFSNAWFFGPISTTNKNLLFYGDIASLDHEDFLEQFRRFLKLTKEESTDFEKSLARQIVGNSRIALRKYNIFAIAVWFTVAALITPLVAFALVFIERFFEKGQKMNKKRLPVFVIAVTALIFGLVYLAIKPNASKNVTSQDVKVGTIIPLSGNLSTYGEPVRDGMLLAIEEINGKGGIKGNKIKLVIEDDAGDPKTAVNAFIKLAKADKVPLVLGPLSSGSSMATAPIAEENKVVQLSTLAGIPELSKAGDYIFRIYPSSEVGARFAASEAIKRFSPKKVAVMYMNNPFGQTAQKIYIDIAKKAGIEVVDTESFSDGENDFRTQLSKIKEGTPDILFCSAYWGEGSKILVQMQELGLDIPVVGEDGWRGPIANIVGQKGLKNLYFADLSFGSEFTDNEIMQRFIKAFENKYQKKASTSSATGYDAVYIAKKTIEEGGYTGESIKNVLYKIDYTGALGRIKFDNNGDDIGVTFTLFQLNKNNEAILAK